MKESFRVQLIAVVGGSAAGKGWVVSRLCRLLGDKAAHLQLDDFYRDRSHLPPARRARINFDVPHAIDWPWTERVLRACVSGEPADLPHYDFATYSRQPSGRPWTPRPLVFVDGLWLLRPPAVRRMFDLKIFLDTPTDLRRSRRLLRDVAERGYTAGDVQHRLRTLVEPMHERYVEPQKRWADVILEQPFKEPELLRLADRLWNLLQAAGAAEGCVRETFRTELADLLATHEYCN
ncbi:MAG: uridine kinase [Opitutaceae bacterium]|nr:uridine kinase [Opitutaceae bacterium]